MPANPTSRGTLLALLGFGLIVPGMLLFGLPLAMPLPPLAGEELGRIAPAFLLQGMAHILTGWDHLAFVLCLALIARGREVVCLVTCFTVGHSITLGLGFLGFVHVPSAPVEIAIPLSLAFVAYEALVVGRGKALLDFRRQIGVVSLFGLLHGFGFAHALSGLGVVPGQELLSLAFFNAGIELGQLLVVGVFAALLAGVRSVLRSPQAVAAKAA